MKKTQGPVNGLEVNITHLKFREGPTIRLMINDLDSHSFDFFEVIMKSECRLPQGKDLEPRKQVVSNGA